MHAVPIATAARHAGLLLVAVGARRPAGPTVAAPVAPAMAGPVPIGRPMGTVPTRRPLRAVLLPIVHALTAARPLPVPNPEIGGSPAAAPRQIAARPVAIALPAPRGTAVRLADATTAALRPPEHRVPAGLSVVTAVVQAGVRSVRPPAVAPGRPHTQVVAATARVPTAAATGRRADVRLPHAAGRAQADVRMPAVTAPAAAGRPTAGATPAAGIPARGPTGVALTATRALRRGTKAGSVAISRTTRPLAARVRLAARKSQFRPRRTRDCWIRRCARNYAHSRNWQPNSSAAIWLPPVRPSTPIRRRLSNTRAPLVVVVLESVRCAKPRGSPLITRANGPRPCPSFALLDASLAAPTTSLSWPTASARSAARSGL